jgi:hypothetical protein
MNIIEAWKLAKDGQAIKRNSSDDKKCIKIKGIFTNEFSFSDTVGHMYDEWFLADDWEIVKEHKVLETTLKGLQLPSVRHIPEDAKVTIEWDE